jgi:hypothetical protein
MLSLFLDLIQDRISQSLLPQIGKVCGFIIFSKVDSFGSFMQASCSPRIESYILLTGIIREETKG